MIAVQEPRETRKRSEIEDLAAAMDKLRKRYALDVEQGREGSWSVIEAGPIWPGLTPVGLCTDPRHAGLPRHMAGQHER